MTKPKKIFISCSEASGDDIAARIVPSLRHQFGADCRIFGITGSALENEGVESWLNIRNLSIMGISQVLMKAPKLLRLVKSIARRLDDDPPDIILCVDAPDFHIRLIEKTRNKSAYRAQIVSPSIWLWRANRAKRFAAAFDAMYCIFPFEPDHYQGLPIHALYVGHPSRYKVDHENIDRQSFIDRFGDQPSICLMPGSRHSELTVLRHDFQAISQRLCGFRLIIPTFEHFLPMLRRWWPEDQQPLFITEPVWRYAAMRYSKAALCCLGTTETELSLRQIPHAAIYRFKGLDKYLLKLFTIYFQHIAMSNILLNGKVVPEFVHDDIDHNEIADTLIRLAKDADLRRQQTAAMQQVYDLLSPPPGYDHYGKTIAADLAQQTENQSTSGSG